MAVPAGRKQRQTIDEDVVFVLVVIAQEIGAQAEVERALETRGEPKLLAGLSRGRRGQVDGDQAVRASNLRIAEDALFVQNAMLDVGANPDAAIQMPSPRGGIEAVVI